MKFWLVLDVVVAFTAAYNYDYKEVLEKSLLFYEAQRSGPLPDNNRIDWRGDSALDDVPVGGYYDGLSHRKNIKICLMHPSCSLFSWGSCQIWTTNGSSDYSNCMGGT